MNSSSLNKIKDYSCLTFGEPLGVGLPENPEFWLHEYFDMKYDLSLYITKQNLLKSICISF